MPNIFEYHEDPEDLMNQTMDINTPPGVKVAFMFPTNGYELEQKQPIKHGLQVGHAYTVERTDISQSYTSVYLREFPGVSFNSVFFCNVPS